MDATFKEPKDNLKPWVPVNTWRNVGGYADWGAVFNDGVITGQGKLMEYLLARCGGHSEWSGVRYYDGPALACFDCVEGLKKEILGE